MKITLRAARVNAGLSVKQASEKMNVSATALRKWELGMRKSQLKPYQKDALCGIYGLSFEDILWPNEGKEGDDANK